MSDSKASPDEFAGVTAVQLAELNEANARLRHSQAELERSLADLRRQVAEFEAKYWALVENLQDVVFVMDRDGNLTQVAGNTMGILGITPYEVMALPPEARFPPVHPDDAPRVRDHLQHSAQLLTSAPLQFRVRDRAGEYRWVEVLWVPLRDRADEFLGTQGLMRDISERVRAEQMMLSLNSAAEVVQRAAFTMLGVFQAVATQLAGLGLCAAVALMDDRAEGISFVPTAGLGHEVSDGVGDRQTAWHLRVDDVPAYARAIRERAPSYFAADERFLLHSFPYPREALERRSHKLTSAPGVIVAPLIADDCVLGLLAVVGEGLSKSDALAISAFANQTATAIRNAQLVDRLRESEEQYRGIVEAATDGFLIYDQQGTVVDANPAACVMHGYALGSLNGRNGLEMVCPDQHEVFRTFLRQVAQGERFQGEAQALRRDGSSFPVEVHGTQLRFHGHTHLLAVVRDITERVKAQEALLHAEKLRALGQMGGGIAHDFNNILVSIRGYADMALLDLAERRDAVATDLQLILAGSADAADAVRRLQSLYREGSDTSDFSLLQLDELVGDALALTQPHWKDNPQSRGLTIDVHTHLASPPPVLGNASELRRVLTNLIVNAVEAMPSGGTLTITTAAENGLSLVKVQDSGTGIPPEVRARMFEPFYTSKHGTGSGLGLTISLSIVERHGGTLQVESLPGQGATFIVRLPAQAGATLPAPTPTAEAGEVTQGKHILVVDDEEAVRELLARFLEREGQIVTVAASGQEAIAALAAQPFDLVITDLGMPNVSGRQVAEKAQNLQPHIPVILATGWGETISPEQLREIGATILLTKPFTHDELFRVLAEALESRRS